MFQQLADLFATVLMTAVVAWWATLLLLFVGANSSRGWSIVLGAAAVALVGAWANSSEPMGWPIHWSDVQARLLAAFLAGGVGMAGAALWRRLRPPPAPAP